VGKLEIMFSEIIHALWIKLKNVILEIIEGELHCFVEFVMSM
jgi:hypothetical protein